MKSEKIKKSLEQFKIIFQRFPITYIVTIILTILSAIIIDTEWIRNSNFITIIKNIYVFGFVFTITGFLIESKFKEKTPNNKTILFVLNTVFSLIFTYITNYIDNLSGTNYEIYTQYLLRFIVCYTLSIVIYSIYSLYKDNKLPINEYLVKTVITMFKNTLVYGLLAIGVLLICLAFITLILEGRNYTLIARIQILLLGIFYVPKMFFAFAMPEDEIGKFAKVVIKYVLGTLVFIAFAVIYMYIIKILILWKVPSNKIFRITATLFILGCPIWTLVSYFKDNDMYQKINNKLPYAFIPFIFMQIYSIGIRIYEYGLTPARYLCVALIIFEIAYLIINYYDKDKLRAVFYSLIVLVLVSGIVPFVNMFKLSQASQYNILKSTKNSIGKANEQSAKARGAFLYLNRSPEGKKLIDSLLSKEEKNTLFAYNEYTADIYNEKYLNKHLNAEVSLDGINVAGYSKLYQINEYLYKYDLNRLDKFMFDVGDNKKIEVNIKTLINMYKEQDENNFDKFFKDNNEYIINDNLKLVLTYFSLSYDEDTYMASSLDLCGYLLEK